MDAGYSEPFVGPLKSRFGSHASWVNEASGNGEIQVGVVVVKQCRMLMRRRCVERLLLVQPCKCVNID
jgi:hypothetical protein